LNVFSSSPRFIAPTDTRMLAADSLPDQTVGTLYSEHHGWLLGWLRRKLACRDDAAELAQDTFMRLLTAREPVAIREPRAYLTTIASGLVINHRQRARLEQAYLDALLVTAETARPSPEERLIVLQALTEIDRALQALPAKARQVFLLSQLDGMIYTDIALHLDISLSTVKRHMVLAFRQCLDVMS